MVEKKSGVFFLQLSVILAALLMGALPCGITVMAASDEAAGGLSVEKKRVYYVKEGECLSSIAEEIYGNAGYWTEIYNANKEIIGQDPDYLQAYVYLELPEAPKRGLTWDGIYERTDNEHEFEVLDSYIGEGVPYAIEECYFYRNTADEKYGRWEKEAGTYDVNYPQLISLNGRNMTEINRYIRKYAMFYAEFFYGDPDKEVAKFIKRGGDFRKVAWINCTERYRITWLDDDFISIVFEHYYRNGQWMMLDREIHHMESLNIDLETGQVYINDEIFDQPGQLSKEVFTQLLERYPEDDSHYTFFSERIGVRAVEKTLRERDGAENDAGTYKTVSFFDKEGAHLAFNYNMIYDTHNWLHKELWRDFDIIDFTAEEIAQYQSDSGFWEKWNPDYQEK